MLNMLNMQFVSEMIGNLVFPGSVVVILVAIFQPVLLLYPFIWVMVCGAFYMLLIIPLPMFYLHYIWLAVHYGTEIQCIFLGAVTVFASILMIGLLIEIIKRQK